MRGRLPTKSPKRGEVWLIDLGFAAKTRPALVLSVEIEDADRALVAIVPHTTSPRASRFEVPLDVKFLDPGVFDCQNLQSVSLAKCLRKLGTVEASPLKTIEATVKRWLGLA